MKNINKYELIIFDLWQTLADIQFRPFGRIIEILGQDISINNFIDKINKSDVFLKDEDIKVTLRNFLFTFNANDKQIKNIIELWKKTALTTYLIEGAMDILKRLKKQNKKLCLMTNIDKFGYEHFLHQELLDQFDYIFLSYKKGLAKPNLECWNFIKKKFDIDFRKMIMIGDNIDIDITPAKKLGIKTIHINNNEKSKKRIKYLLF